jgi:DNA-directed RNA polymerase specialized sigma subunit
VSRGAIDEIEALETALRKLESVSERQCQVVECRFFAGLGIEVTAQALGASTCAIARVDRRYSNISADAVPLPPPASNTRPSPSAIASAPR